MTTEHRDTHAGGAYRQAIIVHDLLRFHDHLPLFLRGSIFHEHIDVRDHIECDLMRERIHGKVLALQEFASLLIELIHRSSTCTRCGLIGRNDHALDRSDIVERL